MAKAAKTAAKKTTPKTAAAKGKRTQAAVKTRKPKAAVAAGQETDLLRRVGNLRAASGKSVSEFGPGDTVGVYVKVREGDKERVQLYRGVCIKVQGKGATRSFTVRKISAGVGVERTFPFRSPALDRVEVIAHGKVRRSKLYFLRELKGKAARLINTMAGGSEDTASADAGSAEA